MKKVIIASFGLLATVMMLATTAQAQSDQATTDEYGTKEILRSSAVNGERRVPFYAIAREDVTARALKSFHKFFTNYTNLQWYRYGKSYLATLNEGPMDTKALFTKNGSMLYTLSFGQEKDLPADVRKMIKGNYVDYTIGRVLKVTSDHQTVWVVNLQDREHIVIVKANDLAFEEMERYPISTLKSRKGRVIIPQ